MGCDLVPQGTVTDTAVTTSVPCSLQQIIFSLVWADQSPVPRGLRRRSAAARLLRSWVRIPPGAWMSVRCECCVLSGRGLCDELITRPEESYRLWCVIVCDQETSLIRRPWTALGRSATGKYTGCNRRKGPDFGRVFLMLNYTEKPQNTYIQS